MPVFRQVNSCFLFLIFKKRTRFTYIKIDILTKTVNWLDQARLLYTRKVMSFYHSLICLFFEEIQLKYSNKKFLSVDLKTNKFETGSFNYCFNILYASFIIWKIKKFIIILKTENILKIGEGEGGREDDNNLIIIWSRWKHQRYVKMGGWQ